MSCSRHDGQWTDFAAGGLSPLAAWRLRRHLAGCAECRARWEQTRQIWTGLRGMAAAPVTQTLHDRVRGRWPRPLSPGKGTDPMKRRMTLLTCALLLVGITAAMAAHVIAYHPSGSLGADGRTWDYTTNLKGRMTILDTQGRKIGVFTNDGAFMTDSAGPDSAWVRLDVAGQEHILRGPGRHEVKDASGALLGYVVFSDVSEADIYREMGWPRVPRDFAEAAKWAEERDPAVGGGASGVTASPTGVRGFDRALGVSWRMRGYGTVRATWPNGDLAAESTARPLPPEQGALLPPGFAPDPAALPEWTLTAAGRTVQETGYGPHVLRDRDGQALMILNAAPLASK